MMEEEFKSIELDDLNINMNRTSLRNKADYASMKRCHTLICVLEDPANITNVGLVLRNNR